MLKNSYQNFKICFDSDVTTPPRSIYPSVHPLFSVTYDCPLPSPSFPADDIHVARVSRSHRRVTLIFLIPILHYHHWYLVTLISSDINSSLSHHWYPFRYLISFDTKSAIYQLWYLFLSVIVYSIAPSISQTTTFSTKRQ